MKKENCDSVMERFLMKDKNEILPLPVILHIITCKECRTMVRRMTVAEKVAKKGLAESMPDDNPALAAVMQKVSAIELASGRNPKPVNLAGWIVAGIIMIIAMMSFGIYTSPGTASSLLIIAFYLVFALSVVIYCTAFVVSNLDFFVKKISFRKNPAISTN
ncbi:MAG: hypothetical protein K5930_05125 [Treponemataceae bacterium]|nr:hypothetical protein [Treponemataceae bacterium]